VNAPARTITRRIVTVGNIFLIGKVTPGSS
jgi:hypothetical protein